jgi:hypothetical protein
VATIESFFSACVLARESLAHGMPSQMHRHFDAWLAVGSPCGAQRSFGLRQRLPVLIYLDSDWKVRTQQTPQQKMSPTRIWRLALTLIAFLWGQRVVLSSPSAPVGYVISHAEDITFIDHDTGIRDIGTYATSRDTVHERMVSRLQFHETCPLQTSK